MGVLTKILNRFLRATNLPVSFQGIRKPIGSPIGCPELLNNHFLVHSHGDHPSRETLSCALDRLAGREACIIETGSAAHGTKSTLLLDSYVSHFGGSLDSVDIRCEPALWLRAQCCNRTTLHVRDSIAFLKNWSSAFPGKRIDLLFLDSWDVNWLNPHPSSMHGLAEYLAIAGHLQKGSLLLVDDTPADTEAMQSAQTAHVEAFERFCSTFGYTPGKCALIKHLLTGVGRGRMVMHRYQFLWEF